MTDRPWVTALNRLLAERPKLKKGELIPSRPGTVSAIYKAGSTPDIATLVKIAAKMTEHDRQANPHAPAVELWEFFVSEEQAALLRDRAERTRQESKDDELLRKGAEMFAAFLKTQQQAALPAPPTVITHKRKKGA